MLIRVRLHIPPLAVGRDTIYHSHFITYGRVLAWAAEPDGREGDEGAPAAWVDASGWLQLLPVGRASDDSDCSRHSRQGTLSGFRL